MKIFYTALFSAALTMGLAQAPKLSPKKIAAIKAEAGAKIDEQAKMAQVMVDKVFSFSELGFQEYETAKYITGILKDNGFSIEMGIAGIPTAWMAKWGSGKPVIALGSDVDCIPKASQKPGVAYHDPIIEGAPGHGEGHNSGVPLNVLAAITAKEIMERDNLPGTLVLWPGIAEEQLGTKAYYTRDGYFDNVDVCLFTHVSSNLGVSWGDAWGTGMISVEYTFSGESAHSAGAPWRGRSAADAVELMSIGWQYQREHLDPLQRSHHIISNGGDQPNVVPSKASIWFYFRQITYPEIMELYAKGNKMAEGAALMTNTSVERRILGSAWPRHFNKTVATTMYENIKAVGLPTWSEEDQMLAKAVQKEVGSKRETDGMPMKISELGGPVTTPQSGGSDDIGDISWKVPTVTLGYPSNIPGLQGHHWSNAIAMATPIAHKGVVAGAKVQAMTILDLVARPELVESAWKYFKEEQSAKIKYQPMIGKEDKPAIYLNEKIMKEFKPELQKYYYDETKYGSYMEQLGITYPTLRKQD
ncbi:MAG: peptidase dimerization domain-containing protein [Cyclobacteriaceae bacterium]|nr:peptidase dimerization domain-containing protein [Cyclobacteriaceae bacterium]MCB0499277.1 peptidase dimerization domain-containing protein [Cyclobacteriaceae bacterium]MCB9237883.1 peptidase dimerization domain-containing protein [Flammeovirgaceae bacterium]MCO5271966.1 peptidase dimerization domain-containing protein [Cyclobacteriaceae bacterium]MCW5902512.1 peptidase dimerization domain-containing protein [Cyclobacteriaceae bacterium]